MDDAVQLVPASVAAIATLGIPALGVLGSWAILGEPAGLSEVAALLLVVPALALLLLDRRVRDARAVVDE